MYGWKPSLYSLQLIPTGCRHSCRWASACDPSEIGGDGRTFLDRCSQQVGLQSGQSTNRVTKALLILIKGNHVSTDVELLQGGAGVQLALPSAAEAPKVVVDSGKS